jgi:hypothetical protein
LRGRGNRKQKKGNKDIWHQSRTLRRPRKSSKHEKKRDTKTTRVIEGEKKTRDEKKNQNKATQKRPPNAVKRGKEKRNVQAADAATGALDPGP